jgi:nicotinate-nucleotide pyrophosphorylase (carboxylating)
LIPAFPALVRAALAEDRARVDVTSRLFLPPGLKSAARIVVRQEGVVAGAAAAAAAFRLLDRRCRVRVLLEDGKAVRPGGVVLQVSGPLSSILSAERTALNFLGHLSGVATLTRAFVRRAGKAVVLDTRKTLPGLRDAEKWAVACGGGANHRRDLAEAVLIKENHLEALGGAKGAAFLVERVGRARGKGLTVEMEARNREEILLGLQAGVDILLLDNFPVKTLAKVVRWIGTLCEGQGLRRPLIEVSGGVTLGTVGAIARAGADRISIGRLTHSAPSLDVGLDVEARRG